MYQLDFEEFLIANGFGQEALNTLRTKLMNRESLDESLHDYIMNLFRRYLLVGGLPAAVNEYLDSHNIVKVRNVQENIRSLYEVDATKYEKDSNKTLLIRRIYNMIPSQLENKKKRIIIKDIQNKIGDRFDNYLEEFEYLISSGTALEVSSISNPKYPLAESAHKNLMKLYLNDVGLLTMLLYKNSIRPVISDEDSVNLGSVYESVVAQELKAHGHKLFYYDNKQRGEVDFLIDDYSSTTILPIEVKSGKDYTRHSALNNLLKVRDYDIASGLVLSNSREIKTVGNVSYMPVYYVMFIDANAVEELYF